MRFWTWLKLFAERQECKAWMDRYYCDQRCPKCDTWQANCGGWRNVELDTPAPFYDVCTCGKCGQQTTLFDFGMGYIAVDPVTLEHLNP